MSKKVLEEIKAYLLAEGLKENPAICPECGLYTLYEYACDNVEVEELGEDRCWVMKFCDNCYYETDPKRWEC